MAISGCKIVLESSRHFISFEDFPLYIIGQYQAYPMYMLNGCLCILLVNAPAQILLDAQTTILV